MRRPRRPRLHRLEALEPRILFSADVSALGIGPEWLADAPTPSTDEPAEAAPLVADSSVDTQDLPVTSAQRHEIVFIDGALPDAGALAAAWLTHGDAATQVDVVMLDAQGDGLAQITANLQDRHELDAIHIVSHAAPGQLRLGDTVLQADTLGAHAAELDAWRAALGEEADLLLWGCDLAASADGQALIAQLAQRTGADVAASTDRTGGTPGADTLLEARIGTVTTATEAAAWALRSWGGELSTYTVTNTLDDGSTGSLRWAITQANANAGTDTISFAIGATGSAQTITLSTLLPTITEAVVLDARTQGGAGYASTPLIRIDSGATSGLAQEANAFNVTGGGSTIAGFSLTRFGSHAIVLQTGGNNVVVGNAIGIDAGNLSDLNQYNVGDGIHITNSSGNRVGGTARSDSNVIAYNLGIGIAITGSSDQNALLGNAVLGNGGAEIDLGADGITANDNLDGDTGANGLQNSADVSSATVSASGTRVVGTLNSQAGASYRIEFFSIFSANGEGSNHGGARRYLGFVDVTTDGAGNASYDTTLATWVNAGDLVTATATRILGPGNYGATSEFGVNRAATSAGGVIVVNTSTDVVDGSTTSLTNLAASRGTDNRISLREAIAAANNTANGGSPDLIAFDIFGWGPQTITFSYDGGDADTSPDLMGVYQSVRIDASTQPGYSGNPLVFLQGGGVVATGLDINGAAASGSTVRGLGFQGFTAQALALSSDANTVVGNWFGLSTTGNASAWNHAGVMVWNGNNNVIGGTTAADRNVMSGNDLGVVLNTNNGTSTGNQVRGNYIGTNAAGNAAIGNVNQGVWVNAANNTIGGTAAGQGNVISGTTGWVGVDLTASASGTLIAGNLIGLNAAGTAALGNLGGGINIASANNTIGGTTAAARNVISGNGGFGVHIAGAAATGNVVIGNYVGTNVAGTADVNGTAKSSGQSGVVFDGGATNNRVGTNADGNLDAAERNVISGNNWYGIEFLAAGTTGNVAQGNYIGTDVTGLVALGNSQGGASFWNGASGNRVGGGATGAGNVIAANETGVLVANGVSSNRVQGNLIGLGADGSTVLGNTGVGIYIYSGGTASAVTGNLIGTDGDGNQDAAERNVISGNYRGVALQDAQVSGNTVAGNYIGTDASGLLDRGNSFDGVYLLNGANANTLGGSLSVQGNVIAGNGGNGVFIADEATDNNVVRGNRIGVNAAGTGTLANDGDGILIAGGADGSLIGGSGAQDGNWIAGNGSVGIEIDGASTGTVIQGNRIGTDLAGTANWGHQEEGIWLHNGASGTLVGGTSGAEGNIIAYSGQGGTWTPGIAVWDAGSTGNVFLRNAVYNSVGLGIDLGNDGVTANDAGDADSGPNELLNTLVLGNATTTGSELRFTGVYSGAANTYYRVEVYSNTSAEASGAGEGRTYLGTVNMPVDASGMLSGGYTLACSVAAGAYISATVTRTDATYTTFYETSEYSNHVQARAPGITVTPPGAPTTTEAGGTAAFTVVLDAAPTADVTVAISSGDSTEGSVSTGLLTFTAANWNVAQTVTVTGVDDRLVDGNVAYSVVTGAASSADAAYNGLNASDVTLSNTDNDTVNTVVVTTTADNNDGDTSSLAALVANPGADGRISLREAITAANNTTNGSGGADRIHFDIADPLVGGAHTLTISSNLDTLTDAVVIDGSTDPDASSGAPVVVLDGHWTAGEGLHVQASGTTVHGLVIQRFNGRGILVDGGASNVTLSGNFIGTDVSGLLAPGNGSWGIDLIGAGTGIVIGGSTAAERNVIGGNTGQGGIAVNNTPGVTIAGNSIGVGADGVTALGNNTGILLLGTTTGTRIGGSAPGEGNLIAHNGGAAVGLWSAGSQAAVLGNRIFDNAGQGIDLGWDGAVQANDAGDADSGPNGLQNFPVLSAATVQGSQITVDGTLNSAANGWYRIEFFASPSGDASGHGEGQVLLGYVNVATDASGNASFHVTLNATVAAGSLVSATATVSDAAYASFGSTSEFAANVTAVAGTGPANTVPAAQAVNEDSTLVFSAVNGNAVTVTDGVAGDGRVRVTLTVTQGTLTLAQTTGLSFVSGANGSATMVVDGLESAVNAAMNGMAFVPTANFNGSANLQVTTALAAGLQGQYSFDSGTAADSAAGTAQDGSFVGNATTVVDGIRGPVLSLDGSGDAVQIAGTFGNPTAVTLGAWVNFSGAGRQELISLDDRVHIALDDGGLGVKGSIQTAAGAWADLTSGVSLSGTGWHHVMYTYDDAANLHTLYIDGAVVASATVNNSIYWTGATTTYIGQHPLGTNWLNGRVDDARIYDRALTTAEVANLAADRNSDTDTVAVTVAAVNDAPVLSNGGTVTASEGSGANPFLGIVTVSDIDSADFNGGTLTATLSAGGEGTDQLYLLPSGGLTLVGANVQVGGVNVGTWSGGTGGAPLSVSFNANAHVAEVQTVYRAVTFSTTSDAPTLGLRTISVVLTDGDGGTSNTATGQVNLNGAVNDAPVNSLPGAQVTPVNTALVFSAANGNAVSVADVDAGAASLRVTLSVAHGSLTLAGTTGLSFSIGDGTSDASMTFTGTVSAINAALNGLSYTPTAAYQGSDTLSLSTNDQGNTGSGGNLTDSDTLSLQVGALRYQEGVNGYTGTQDTWVSTSSATTDHGAETTVVADDNSGSDAALLRFDNVFGSGVGQIPLGSTITGATLSIYVTDGDSADSIALHQMLSAWTEASTYNSLITGVQTNGSEAGSSALLSFDAGTTGWVTLSGAQLTAVVQAWANGEANHGFAFISNNADRWTFASSENGSSNLRPYLSINHTPPQAPVVTPSGGAASYTENGAAVAVDPGLALSDADSTQLTGATVRISANYVNGQDVLAFTNQGGITGTWDAVTGTLTLAGTATVAQYQAALRTVSYSNGSDNPSTLARTIEFNVSDGLTSTLATRSLNLTAVNDAPVLGFVSGNQNYTENAGAVVISASATITDLDSSDFAGGRIVVSITANGQAEDRLAVRHQGNGAGQIGVSGSVVSYGGVTIGSLSGGTDGSTPLVITLNSNATQAAVQALARNLTYENVSDNPSSIVRTVQGYVEDGDGGTSNIASGTLTIIPVNDAPTLVDGTALGLSATDEDTPSFPVQVNTLLFASGTADADNTVLQGLALTGVTGRGTWQYSTDGSTWTNVGTVSGSQALLLDAASSLRYLPDGVDGETVGFSFRAWDQTSGSASTFGAPSTADPGAGGGSSAFSSQSASASRVVTPVNDAPTLSTSSSSLAFNENDAASAVDTGLSLGDIDHATLTGATVRISVNYANGQDVLAFTDQSGITGSWDATTGTLTLSGSATLAQYQAALRSVTYVNTSEDPSILVRTVSFTATDGVDTSAAATRQVQVVSINDAPTTADASASGAEDAASIAITLTGSDVDGTVDRFRLNTLPAHGTLYLDAGLTTVAATGTDYAATGQALTLYFVPDANWNGSTSFGFVARDALGSLDATAATATLTVTPVNDAPVAVGESYTLAEDSTLTIPAPGVLANDSDVDGDTLQAAAVTLPSHAATFNFTTAGNIVYTPVANFVGTDSFTYLATDGALGSTIVTVTFTVTAVNDAPVLAHTAPGATINEDMGLVIRVSDLLGGASDVDGPAQGVALVGADTTHGTWSYSLDAGATWTAVGSVDAAHALLLPENGANSLLYFAPQANWNGSLAAALTLRAWDGSSGSAGTLADTTSSGGASAYSSATDDFSLNVNPVNDAPTLTTTVGSLSYNENAGAQPVDPGISAGDIDSATLTGATVQISTAYASGEDVLAFTDQNGISGSWDASSGTLTLSGSASVAQYQAALRSITYTNTSEAPSILVRTVSFTVTDGSLSSNPATRQVQVASWNDAPTTTDANSLAAEDTGSMPITLRGDDVDGTVLSFRLSSLPANGSLYLDAAHTLLAATGVDYSATAQALTLYFAPNAHWHGSTSFQYAAVDATGLIDASPATGTLTVSALNDAPTGAPVIVGSATEDQTLSVDTASIADVDGLGAFTIQWLRDGVAIGGANATTYTLGDADVGTSLAVQVSYTDGDGTAESLTSSGLGPVANVNDAPTGAPVIVGTPTEDQTLSIDPSGIADADGLGAFTLQWLRDGVAVAGATASTYTLGDADVGAVMSVRVSYTDGQGSVESLTSAATAPVAHVNDAPSGSVTIDGTPTEDQTLSANTSALTDADGLGAYSYQWLRDGVAIAGATASSYTLGDADVGAQISLRVDYVDGQGTAESLTSATVGPITSVDDAPTGSVTIDGTPTEDQTLSANTSALADADGLGAYSYQWLRDGVAIAGAHAANYTLGDADVGAQISVSVSYLDGQGTTESLTSAAVGPIANINDTPTGSVTIDGTPTEDQTLSANTSALADADGLGAFSYQWLRNGVAISGATGNSYTLVDADVGTLISLRVDYVDGHGTAESLTSAAVGPIANVDDAPNGSVTIDGTPTEDQTLTANTSTVADVDGLGAFSYQWLRDGIAISGATGNSYTLVDADVGTLISLRVDYVDGHGTAESPTSAAVGPIANVDDAPNGSVTIDGTPTEDQTLTANTSAVADVDGLGALTYQWLRNGVAIAGANTNSYALGDLDVGQQISVRIDYVDGQGSAESLTSAAVGPIANLNDAPTGSVTITGTPTEDQTLSANTGTLADLDGLGAFGYQWLRNGVAISGATTNSYVLGDLDVGQQISVRIDYVDGQGTAESLTSAAVGPVANVNDAPAGNVTIDGTPTEDQTLSANTSTLADADGLGDYSYQWLRNGVAISGATGNSYTLVDADVGTQISLRVDYVDGQGTAESLTSATVGPIANVNDAPAGNVTIDGTPTEDQTLSANTSALADADGLGAYSYQWLRNGVAIAGAHAANYTLGDADVGTQISVSVTYLDGQGTTESLASAAVGPIANVNDAPTGSVTIDGTPTEDQTLSANTGTLADADGLGAFSYQWLRDGVAITGATGSNYTLVRADAGTRISVLVHYVDAQGQAESVGSASVGPVLALNHAPTSQDLTLVTDEDQPLVLGPSDFDFVDADAGQSLQSVRITVLPGAGTLRLDGQTVQAGDSIAAAALAAGRLVYTPVADAHGSTYATLDFVVSDGEADSAVHRITIDVRPVDDPADFGAVTSVALGTRDTQTLGPNDLWLSDIDNDVQQIRIQVQASAGGHLEDLRQPGAPITSFTWADLSQGQVRFVVDGQGSEPWLELEVEGAGAHRIRFLLDTGTPAPAPAPAPPTDPGSPPTPAPLPSPSPAPGPAPTDAAPRPAAPAPAGEGEENRGVEGLAMPTELRRSAAGGTTGRDTANTRSGTGDANFGASAAPAASSANGEAEINLDMPSAVPARFELSSIDPGRIGRHEEEAEVRALERLEKLLDALRAAPGETAAAVLSAGFVWWSLRAAGLVASLLASTPVWRQLDPIPVLGGDDDEDDAERGRILSGDDEGDTGARHPDAREAEALRDEAASRELFDDLHPAAERPPR